MTALPSHPVRIRYGPGDDLLAELYLPVLERAVRHDRLVRGRLDRIRRCNGMMLT